MRIRKLELNGFKSFPERAVVEFGPGISCVVGPNGCGKSNILDAIKWVIGEQSAKALRGGEMLDVIFAGSQARAAVGFAEVAMTLTAEDGEPFPGDYARLTELQVGRRLHRTGASEYFINQTRCRRKDITELFLDTGVASDLYCFIEQGSVGKIVQATAAERRTLIEEAAGISRYKARREEARERLAATGAQLDRAADVTEELERRLRLLEGQVWKAARYRRLRARLRQQEIVLALARYADLASERRATREQLRDARRRAEAHEREMARRQVEVDARREEIAVVEAGAGTWRDEVAEQDARIRELEATLAFSARRRDELDEQTRAAEVEARSLEEATAETARRGEALVLEIASLRAEVAVATEAEAETRSHLERARAARVSARAGLAQAEAASTATSLEVEAAGARITEVEARLAELPGQVARRGEAVSEAERAVGALRDRLVEVQRARAEAGARLETATAAADAASAARDAARATLIAAEAEEARLRRARSDERQGEARALRDGEEAVRVAEAAFDRARSVEVGVDAGDQRVAIEAAVRAAESEGARRRDAAARRARAWLDAFDRSVDAERDAEEVAWAHRMEAADEAIARAVADAEAAGVARLREVEEAAGRAAVARVTEATAARDAAWTDHARARERREAVELRQAAIARRVAEIDAAVAGLRERDRADPVLHARLGARSTLLERLQDEGHASDDLAALGDRALLPVVDRVDEILALAQGLDDVARVAWPIRVPEEGALLAGTQLVDDLAAALAHHRSTGGAAAVRGTGEHVGVDGTVTLGRVGDAARAAARRRDERQRLEAELVGLRREAEQRAEEHEGLVAGEASARRTATDAEEVARDVERDANASVEHARASCRAGIAASVAAARAGAEAERERLRQAAEAVFSGGMRRATEARAQLQEMGDRGLEAVRVEVDASIARERERAEARALEATVCARAAAAAEVEGARALLADRRAALEALRASHEAREAEHVAREAVVVAALDAAREQARAAEQEAVAALASRASADVAHTRAAGEVDGVLARIVSAERVLEAARVERIAADDEAKRVAEALEDARARWAAARARAADGPDLDALRAEVARVESAEDGLSRAQSEAALAVATLAERLEGSVRAQEAATRSSSELAERRAALVARVAGAEVARIENEERIRAAEASLEGARSARAEAWDRLQRERTRLVALREQHAEHEEALRVATAAQGEATRQAAALDGAVREAQAAIDALRERIDERYLVSLPGLLDRLDAHGSVILPTDDDARDDLVIGTRRIEGVPDHVLRPASLQDFDAIAALVDEVEEGRRRLLALGEVNLAAVEEYDDVVSRHADLVAQRDDLEQAIARIREAIAKMNRTCRERFRETFDRVAANLAAIYPRLTGGGQARLALTDEEDLLETGVEIFVQPPGKRLQNLTLLSGGEKAMTAIAMLLALFQVKPSPFCVLDEVDAPLDEANGGRFNEVLREMAGLAQFILITHNRKTMEAADTLYGVTMPTPGVSRLVSVRLDA